MENEEEEGGGSRGMVEQSIGDFIEAEAKKENDAEQRQRQLEEKQGEQRQRQLEEKQEQQQQRAQALQRKREAVEAAFETEQCYLENNKPKKPGRFYDHPLEILGAQSAEASAAKEELLKSSAVKHYIPSPGRGVGKHCWGKL